MDPPLPSAPNSSKRKSTEFEDSENADPIPRQKRMKNVAESHENDHSIPGLEGTSPEQKCMSSLQIKLQADKQQLEKYMATKEQDVKFKDNEIAFLRGGRQELQKLVQIKDQDCKDKDEEITVLKSQLNEIALTIAQSLHIQTTEN